MQKNAKFLSAGGSAPRPSKQPSPLRISGYSPGGLATNKLCSELILFMNVKN